MNRVLVPQQVSPAASVATGDPVVLRGRTMGTDWCVHLCGELPPQRWLQLDIQQTLDRLDGQMSHWSPQSDLGVFNRRESGTWQPIPDDFFAVLDLATKIARDTDGLCDPTLGALVNLWGFGPAPKRSTPPEREEVERARRRCGWQQLQLDAERQRVFQPGGLELDLSCIAKGHAVDVIAQRLLGLGLEHFLVEIGGELRGSGWKADGSPWWGEIEQPDDAAPRTLVALHGLAIATSGDYRQGFEHQGVRYSHTLDPRSSWPLSNTLASVSVMHRLCVQADAQATVLSVLGTDAGLAYADANDLAAVFLRREPDGRCTEHLSRAAAAMLE